MSASSAISSWSDGSWERSVLRSLTCLLCLRCLFRCLFSVDRRSRAKAVDAKLGICPLCPALLRATVPHAIFVWDLKLELACNILARPPYHVLRRSNRLRLVCHILTFFFECCLRHLRTVMVQEPTGKSCDSGLRETCWTSQRCTSFRPPLPQTPVPSRAGGTVRCEQLVSLLRYQNVFCRTY